MRKIKYLLLMVLLIPTFVYADDNLNYQIKTHVDLEGKQLEAGEFTFELKDTNGNLIDTATNDSNGDVVFNEVFKKDSYSYLDYSHYKDDSEKEFGKEKNFNYQIYSINQVNNKNNNYTLDNTTTYVSVEYRNDKIEINYLNIDKLLNDMPKYDKKEKLHVTDDMLKGYAYAVFDSSNNTFTFFRDDIGKYSDNQVIGTKAYFTSVENRFKTWPDSIISKIEKVIVKDYIKPIDTSFWFAGGKNIKEIIGSDKIDTSNVKNMNSMFRECILLKKLDISTWDTSKVETMQDTFQDTPLLSELDYSALNFSSISSNGVANFLKKSGLTYFSFDFTDKFVTNNSISSESYLGGILQGSSNLKYINLKNTDTVASEEIWGTKCLNVVELRDDYFDWSSHIGDDPDNRDNIPYWYSLNNNIFLDGSTMVDFHELLYYQHQNLYNHNMIGGTWIRPVCHPEPINFRNTYKATSVEVPKTIKENPKTGIKDHLLIIILITFISFIAYKFVNKKDLFKKM